MNDETLRCIAWVSMTLAFITFVYCLHCIRDREAKDKRIKYLEKRLNKQD